MKCPVPPDQWYTGTHTRNTDRSGGGQRLGIRVDPEEEGAATGRRRQWSLCLIACSWCILPALRVSPWAWNHFLKKSLEAVNTPSSFYFLNNYDNPRRVVSWKVHSDAQR